MKTVYSNNELPHIWVHRCRDMEYGRNAKKSMFFETEREHCRSTFYSYGCAIARIDWSPTLPPEHTPVVLLNWGHYSITTSRHQSRVFGALTPELRANAFRVADPKENPILISRWFQNKANEIWDEALLTRRSRKRDELVATAQRLIDDANRFRTIYQLLELHGTAQLPGNEDERKAELLEIHRRQKEEARRRQEEIRLAAEALVKVEEVRIPSWHAGGEPSWYPSGDFRAIHGDLLRIGFDPKKVETSRGVFVPLEDVLKVVPLIKQLYSTSGKLNWAKEMPKQRLGHYTLDRIDEAGDVYVGCHVFKRAEVERFIQLLEVLA